MSYLEWITAYSEQKEGNLLGRCAEATKAMVAAFPELTRVPGHVYGYWGKRAHWWCETADGQVVDPTASQFPDAFLEYERWMPGDEVRVGKCMNCGSEIWREVKTLDEEPPRESFCDATCIKECFGEDADAY